MFRLTEPFGTRDLKDYHGRSFLLVLCNMGCTRAGTPLPLVDKMEHLFTQGSDVGEKDNYGANCLHTFFCSSMYEKQREPWLDALIFLVQRGADVFSADTSGFTVSDIAYTRRVCREVHRYYDFGSYRGDLWDAVLQACGHDLLAFRRGRPRRAYYNDKYTRQHFESMWAGREDQCPYWNDEPWPTGDDVDTNITTKDDGRVLCVCHYNDRPTEWLDINNINSFRHCLAYERMLRIDASDAIEDSQQSEYDSDENGDKETMEWMDLDAVDDVEQLEDHFGEDDDKHNININEFYGEEDANEVSNDSNDQSIHATGMWEPLALFE
ncbi:hypothetical protein HD806DRAFT_296581 [Xylariaceae sp. AK1471]|nr:hypothetical protein HD806DRAFT_296581 [Xylariaceae sp. AK1471]